MTAPSSLNSRRRATHSPTNLNAQRAQEEKTGKVRWLRPAFQNAAAYQAASKVQNNTLQNKELIANEIYGLQTDLIPKSDPNNKKLVQLGRKDLPHWPSTLAAQVSAVAQRLAAPGAALSLADIEASFKGQGPWKKSLPRILETLKTLGRARREVTGSSDGWRASTFSSSYKPSSPAQSESGIRSWRDSAGMGKSACLIV